MALSHSPSKDSRPLVFLAGLQLLRVVNPPPSPQRSFCETLSSSPVPIRFSAHLPHQPSKLVYEMLCVISEHCGRFCFPTQIPAHRQALSLPTSDTRFRASFTQMTCRNSEYPQGLPNISSPPELALRMFMVVSADLQLDGVLESPTESPVRDFPDEFIAVGRPTQTVDATLPWAGVTDCIARRKGAEHQHPSLLPDCGCNVTRGLEHQTPCPPNHDRL